jgi:serine/threonine-protein kinase
MATRSAPRIGTVFAGYRIEAICGRGGMSVVYRAENPRLGNTVALKLLTPELAEDERELSPTRALDLAGQVAGALDAAHERGLIHRDVKPANILIESGSEEEDHAYLTDFGLTKHVESRSGITGSGHFVGTIDYMAPEQIEGRDVDARVDVYALGCLLFECLAGGPPFRRDTEVAVLWAHMRDEPPALSAVRPELGEGADDALRRALSKNPADRPDSCGALVSELRQELREPGATLVGVPRPRSAATVRAPRPRRASRRGFDWRPLAAAALAGLLIGAGVASAVLLPGRGGSTKTLTRVLRQVKTTKVTESFLQPLIPAPVWATCARAPKLRRDVFETFSCEPGHGVDSVQYNLFRGQSLMNDRFHRRLTARGIPVFGSTFTSGGECSIGENAVGYWVRRNRRGGHNPSTFSPPSPQIRGAFLCYHDQHRGWIEWTDNRLLVYSVATGRDPVRLYEWWAAQGGPTS